jgi:hypothetical protein
LARIDDDRDGVVRASDLAGLLGAWGPCAGRAADPGVAFRLDTSDRERFHALQLCREACFGRAAVVGRRARVLEVVDGA